MRAAKEAIEAEAREKAATKAATRVAEEGGDDAAVEQAAEMAAAEATPSKKAQRNFTDPESRMMKTTDGFHYAYNAQTVVDEAYQVVLAAEVTNQAADVGELTRMIGVTEGNLDAADIEDSPGMVLADAGYCSEARSDNQPASDSRARRVPSFVVTGGCRLAKVYSANDPAAAIHMEQFARRGLDYSNSMLNSVHEVPHTFGLPSTKEVDEWQRAALKLLHVAKHADPKWFSRWPDLVRMPPT